MRKVMIAESIVLAGIRGLPASVPLGGRAGVEWHLRGIYSQKVTVLPVRVIGIASKV